MTRYEVKTKVDDADGTLAYHMQNTTIPLVGNTIYGESEFDWSTKQRHSIVMHSLPDTARIVLHKILVQGFGESGEDAANNYFTISNCYYVVHGQHLQPLSIEAISTPDNPTQFWHRFSSTDSNRYRMIGYNSKNYANNTYKAPYTYSCMQYQYLSLRERKLLDFPHNPHFGTTQLVFAVEGKNSLPNRPLVFTSIIEYYI
jgi:hypothetical protein